MVCGREKARTVVRALRSKQVGEGGFTYIELLVAFSLTVFLLTVVLSVGSVLTTESRLNGDALVLQREASAFHFLLLNEMKRGYDVRVLEGSLYFNLSSQETVRIRHDNWQLVRQFSDQAGKAFKGHVILSRHVESARFVPDADRQGVTLQIVFAKGEARLTFETYWRTRAEEVGASEHE